MYTYILKNMANVLRELCENKNSNFIMNMIKLQDVQTSYVW
jgi:hypothetical protein